MYGLDAEQKQGVTKIDQHKSDNVREQIKVKNRYTLENKEQSEDYAEILV